MAAPVNPPRGMRDFLPADKARRQHALGVIRSVYRAQGFDEIETPMVEDYARLHSGLGGDNEKLSFSILKRGIDAEALRAAAEADSTEALTDLGLRFDLTVPLARFYASHRAELPGVFRSVQIGPVWRAERPQKGRYRQFVQADIDIIGEPGLLAEIELITATATALDTLGLRDCVIRVNDRRLLTALLAHCGFLPEEFDGALITVDKLDKIGASGVVAELAETNAAAAAALGAVLAGVEPRLAGDGIALSESEIRAVLPAGLAEEAVAALAELAGALTELPDGVTLRFDPTLVRGMGYYTGIIYEIAHPSSGSSVGGGGRYDGMIGRFLGEDVPAAGFSIGFERVVDLIDLPNEAGPESVVLLYDRDATAADLSVLKQQLVAEGRRVRLERRPKNPKPMLARAEEAGFAQVASVRAGVRNAQELEFRPLGAR